jgi:hypothetical protein
VKKEIQRMLVEKLEDLCGFIDRNVPGYWDGKWHRGGQWGCSIGLAAWSVRLDDRWQTGYWKNGHEADPTDA